MEYRFKAGQKVRILDVESLGDRSEWAGRELTLALQDSGGGGDWDVPAWSMVERDCHYRFRESEMALAGPVRTETVTVRRLEPGVYGPLKVGVEISIPDCDRPDEPSQREVEAYLTRTALNASEWRELARVALEIAEYLDAQ